MIQAISKINFPDGHTTERVFRWYGVDSNLIALIGAAVARGGSFSVRPALPSEVAASDAARLRAKKESGNISTR
jgi:hypothetical protein